MARLDLLPDTAEEDLMADMDWEPKEGIEFREIKATSLDVSKSYIFQVELGDMPKEQVGKYITHLADLLVGLGFNVGQFIIVPIFNGVGQFNISELNKEER